MFMPFIPSLIQSTQVIAIYPGSNQNPLPRKIQYRYLIACGVAHCAPAAQYEIDSEFVFTKTKGFPMKKTILVFLILFTSACGSGSNNGKSPSSLSHSSSSSNITSSMQSSSAIAYRPEDNDWKLVFSDEFDGNALDQTKWSYEYNCKGNGSELQCYTEEHENINVQDGKLHIVARKENFSGPAYWNDEPEYDPNDSSKTLPYTSGRIRTLNKGDWLYGRFEVKAKIPQGFGTWPAIWMMPSDAVYGSWPASGEIDIFEAFGSNTPNWGNKIAGTLHYGQACCENFLRAMTGKDFLPPGNNIWSDYHIYAFEWEADEMRWYVDHQLYAVQQSNGWFTVYGDDGEKIITNNRAPFDQHFHMILNLAIDGAAGDSINQTLFPQEMVVDYVRVYQCDLDTATGVGCASHTNPSLSPITTTPLLKQKYFADGTVNQSFSYQSSSYGINLQLEVVGADDKPIAPVITPDSAGHNLWALSFDAMGGSGFIRWAPSENALFENAFDMAGLTRFGQLRFDMLIESLDENSEIKIGMQSLHGETSYYTLKNSVIGEWQSISVPYINMVAGNLDTPGANSGIITKPFIIQTTGAAQLKLNNIQFECRAKSCDLKPLVKAKDLYTDFSIFDDTIDPLWLPAIQTYDSLVDAARLQVRIMDSGEGTRGNIIDAQWPNATGQISLFYLQSRIPRNAAAFVEDGYLSFDIKVLSYGSNTQGLQAGVWCGWPCGSHNLDLPDIPADGNWHTIAVPIKDFLGWGTLDLSKVVEPFVIFPTLDNQRGVHIQVDNIRWILN